MEKGRKSMSEGFTATVVEDAPKAFSLPKRKVKVIPVKRVNPMATNPKESENNFLYGKAHKRYTLPRTQVGGNFVNPFKSDQERWAVESALSMDKDSLSVNKRENNFWTKTYQGVILTKDERILDLSDPNDYISYCVLMTNKHEIAPDEDSIKKTPYCKFAIVDLGYEDTQSAVKSDLIADAAVEFAKIRNNRSALVDALYLLNPTMRVAPDATLEWLKGQVGNHMTKDPARFIRVLNDPQANTRILIAKAIHCKAITIDKGVYRTSDRIVGISLDGAIGYLNEPINADFRSLIEAQVIASK